MAAMKTPARGRTMPTAQMACSSPLYSTGTSFLQPRLILLFSFPTLFAWSGTLGPGPILRAGGRYMVPAAAPHSCVLCLWSWGSKQPAPPRCTPQAHCSCSMPLLCLLLSVWLGAFGPAEDLVLRADSSADTCFLRHPFNFWSNTYRLTRGGSTGGTAGDTASARRRARNSRRPRHVQCSQARYRTRL